MFLFVFISIYYFFQKMNRNDKNLSKPLSSSQMEIIFDPLSDHSLEISTSSSSLEKLVHSSSNPLLSSRHNQEKNEEKDYFEKCISLGNYSGMENSVCVSICFKLLDCMQIMGSLGNFFFFSQLLDKLEKILLLNHNLLQNSISVASEKYVFHFQLLMHASIISDNYNFSKQSLNFINLVNNFILNLLFSLIIIYLF
jgi:hypothetical protein